MERPLSWPFRARGVNLRLAIAVSMLLGVGLAIAATAKSGSPSRAAQKSAETFERQADRDFRPKGGDRASAPMREFTALVTSSRKPIRLKLVRPIPHPKPAATRIAYRRTHRLDERRRDMLSSPTRTWANERIVAASGPHPLNSESRVDDPFAPVELNPLGVAIGTATGVSSDLLLGTYHQLNASLVDASLGPIAAEE